MHPQPPRRTTHAYGTPKNLIVYDRWGRFGRPVVLLHGLCYDRTMWWPVAAELGAACAAVAVDLPGHGESAPREDYGLDAVAHDLAMLVHGLDLRRAPILVAHAESALLAAAFAERFVTRTVIRVGSGPPGEEEIPEPYRQFAVPRQDSGLRRSYRDWIGPQPDARAGFPHLRDPAGFAARLQSVG
ncbi:alpha/beta fold hydrolase [Actinoplanes sp. NPDC051861]|uniref:alpha/beta fold hydrolase n=1 Tax=Actinoplanes sp. NPDC051861 TaxID=3155170 RepID=UPI00344AB401